ncbi:outer membrane protein OmpA-like peptidoglycan-associated protein [Neisseria sp. HSC-16F19]|nr:OmpA family protein [Neisseria sp. HSC-16F19]MCP2039950.1 outer membrane protein OmpA-like peptidoglycan-associated protein [Neisseria sp. HSC-16F19]
MKTMQFVRGVFAAAAAAAVLSGCAAVSFVKPDGTTDEPKWPKWDSVSFDKKRGTFPDLGSLRQVKPGLTKDQMYYLLGRPHYAEAWRPVEWNYLFHFHTPGQGTDGVTTCQFKVLYDKNMITRSFHWNPVDPATATCPPLEQPAKHRYTLGADALFAFDRSSLADLQPGGRQELDNLAAKLKQFDELNSITVTGHTDRLGSDAYNDRLSQQRADTVRAYLVQKGLPAAKITARGMGERAPVTHCSDNLGRNALITCLQPNRRVEVEVDGYGSK